MENQISKFCIITILAQDTMRSQDLSFPRYWAMSANMSANTRPRYHAVPRSFFVTSVSRCLATTPTPAVTTRCSGVSTTSTSTRRGKGAGSNLFKLVNQKRPVKSDSETLNSFKVKSDWLIATSKLLVPLKSDRVKATCAFRRFSPA